MCRGIGFVVIVAFVTCGGFFPFFVCRLCWFNRFRVVVVGGFVRSVCFVVFLGFVGVRGFVGVVTFCCLCCFLVVVIVGLVGVWVLLLGVSFVWDVYVSLVSSALPAMFVS